MNNNCGLQGLSLLKVWRFPITIYHERNQLMLRNLMLRIRGQREVSSCVQSQVPPTRSNSFAGEWTDLTNYLLQSSTIGFSSHSEITSCNLFSPEYISFVALWEKYYRFTFHTNLSVLWPHCGVSLHSLYLRLYTCMFVCFTSSAS